MSLFLNQHQDPKEKLETAVRKPITQNNLMGTQQRAKTSELKKRGGNLRKLNDSVLNKDIKVDDLSQQFESR